MNKRYSPLDKAASPESPEFKKVLKELEEIYHRKEEEARKKEERILTPEILQRAKETLSAFHQQEITITTISAFEAMRAKRSAGAIIKYNVGSREEKARLKELDLSSSLTYTPQGHAYGRNRSNYLREKIFLEHFQAWGCSTPEYKGSFTSGEKGYLLQRFYEGEDLHRYVLSALPQDEYVGLLIWTAETLARFNARATLNAPSLWEKLQQDSVEMMTTTVDFFIRKWASELSVLHGPAEIIDDRARINMVATLVNAPKYALHRDFQPWNVLYCQEQGLEDQLIIFDLETASLPTPSGTTGGPLAYDLGTLLIWPVIQGKKITAAEKELIIHHYISTFNRETETEPKYRITNLPEFQRQIDAGTLMAVEFWQGAEMRHQPLQRFGYGQCLDPEEKYALELLRQKFE